MTVNHGVVGSSPTGGAKKSKSKDLDFFICVRRTQHHLTEGQHHFKQSENIISHSSGHKMMLCFAQMKLRQAANDVMLRINDVGSRPMMLRSVQIELTTSHFCDIIMPRRAVAIMSWKDDFKKSFDRTAEILGLKHFVFYGIIKQSAFNYKFWRVICDDQAK